MNCRFLALLALLGGCAQQGSAVQGVTANSGDFGVADTATVRAIDPISLRGNFTRFNISFGEFTLSVLSADRPDAVAIWGETTRSFGDALAGELEEYIRGLSCVYTVAPDGDFIPSAVADVVRSGGIDDDDDILVGTVIPGSGIAFEELAPATEKSATRRRDGADEAVEVAIVSNCLLEVYPGDAVRIVQTPERMLILPQRLTKKARAES